MTSVPITETINTPAHVRIYQIQLEGHGREARLKAQRLSTFTVPGTGKFTNVDISGELLARPRRTKEGSFLEVLKWRQSTSITHTRVRIPVDQGIVSHSTFKKPISQQV